MKKKPYGGIKDVPKYLLEKYGSEGKMIKQGPIIPMNTDSMETISGRRTRNCSVVAVARVIEYYGRKNKIVSIPADIQLIYKDVEKVARRHLYTDRFGTNPLFISRIARRTFAGYGVKIKSKGIYVWSFEEQVEKEISAGRPVIMNIARGFYRDHTVVVAGYSVWQVGEKIYPMIRVIDGWKSGYHYIDYEAFAKDITQSIFGSFNTIEVQK